MTSITLVRFITQRNAVIWRCAIFHSLENIFLLYRIIEECYFGDYSIALSSPLVCTHSKNKTTINEKRIGHCISLCELLYNICRPLVPMKSIERLIRDLDYSRHILGT